MSTGSTLSSDRVQSDSWPWSEDERHALREPRLGARVAVAVSLIVVVFFLWHAGILPSSSTTALMILCGVEILSLPLYAYFINRFGRSVLQAYLRWMTDIVLMTFAIHYLGGHQAFLFSFVYCLVILSTSMMAHRRDSFLLATMSAVCYLGLLLLEETGRIPSHSVWHLHLGRGERFFFPLLSVMFFFLTAYFSSIFSDRLRQRGKTLETVNAISRVSSSSLALQEILDRTLNFVLEHLQAEWGLIQLANQPGNTRFMDTETRRFPEDLPEGELLSIERLVKVLMDEKQPVVIKDLRNDPKCRHLGIRWIGSLVAAPIIHKGEILGLLVLLDKKHHWDPHTTLLHAH